jgi:hypothetical protein
MRTPQVFLAYAPRGAGLRCLVAYLESGRDVYGWFTGPRDDGSLAQRYFVIENFHSPGQPVYDAAEEVHSPWLPDEARRHELAALQEAAAHEWLEYRDDAQFAAGVRPARLHKFSTLQPNWTYWSPGFERSVLRFLAKRWPLEYRPEDEAIETRGERHEHPV